MTRQEYMTSTSDRTEAHRAYYGQFVTPGIRAVVARSIGLDRIKSSPDPHFNDIPLREWDNAGIPFRQSLAKAFHDHGDSLSEAGIVCVLKEAARQLVVE